MSDYSHDKEQYFNWNGKIIQNKYIFIKKLGHGAFASVWLTFDIINKKLFAVKIHNINDYDYGVKEYLLYKKFNDLNIPHILNPIDTFDINIQENSNEKHYCIVMELMGCSLYTIIKDAYNKITTEFINKILIQLFKCTKVLHKNNYVHADIKPENILLQGYTEDILNISNTLNTIENDMSKIIQFVESFYVNQNNDSDCKLSSNTKSHITLSSDNSYETSDSSDKPHVNYDNIINHPNIFLSDLGSCVNNTTSSKKYYNTCYYAAPETLLKLECNYKTDMWGIGCTLYELVTGRILFDPDIVKNMKTRHHITQIITSLGDIPSHMKCNSPDSDIFFKKNGIIKGVNELPLTTIWTKLKTTDCIKKLLFNLLRIDPDDRIDSTAALELLCA